MTIELDRHIAPKTNSIKSVEIPMPKRYELSNGTEVFVFNNENQNIVKVEVVFDKGGTVYSPKPLVASITNAMITESTSNFTSAELAGKIDYYGASFETKATRDYSSVSLYSLNKHLSKTLPLLQEVIKFADYKKEELDVHISRKKQEFMVNSQKVDFVARQHFTQLLFGENHPYGKFSVIEDFDLVSSEDLIAFHKQVYAQGKHKIYIAGNFGDAEFILLDDLFSSMKNMDSQFKAIDWSINQKEEKYTFIAKEGAVQNAIRMGFVGLKRDHEDYNGLRILTIFLGGYFGSRLMSNIREDKGYTYGIGAAHSPFKEESVFFIATEVKSEVAQDTIFEINKEIERLKDEQISTEELITVVNYLQGSFQRQFDGSFALLEKFKNIEINNIDYNYYYDYINAVKTIDVAELQKLARKYFEKDKFYILNVGNQ
ncbi:MAG: insulinase family protein [Bacteroidales bacterium]|nr:insulinase family protein [Bacteroidales bacterium]